MKDCKKEFSAAKTLKAIIKKTLAIVENEAEILLPMNKKYKIREVHKIPVEVERYGMTPNERRTYYVIDCATAN